MAKNRKLHTVSLFQNIFCGLDVDGYPIIHPQAVDVKDVLILRPEQWTEDEITEGSGAGYIGVPKSDPHIWKGQNILFNGNLWAVCGLPKSEYISEIPADEYRQYIFVHVASAEDIINDPDIVRRDMETRGII